MVQAWPGWHRNLDEITWCTRRKMIAGDVNGHTLRTDLAEMQSGFPDVTQHTVEERVRYTHGLIDEPVRETAR